MIRWCSYCQGFMGEKAPYDRPVVSHGVCPDCEVKLEKGEEIEQQTAVIRALMDRIFACALDADPAAIPALVAEARACGLPPESLMVGLLQPALYRVGKAWQDGTMSVAAEHRFTMWCERFLAQLPVRQQGTRALDLLIFLAPGNSHTLGPRFAAELFASRGISTEVVVPELPLGEMVAEIERLGPRLVGISCTQPTSLPSADALVHDLRARVAPTWNGRFVLGGFALRSAGADWKSAFGTSVAVTTDDIERLLDAKFASP